MRFPTLAQLAQHLAGLSPLWIALWLGLVGLSVALLILTRTRWGQSRPLRKCAVLSLLAHVLLAGFATTVKIVSGAAGLPPTPSVHVTISTGEDETIETIAADPAPWDPAPQAPDFAIAQETLSREFSDPLPLARPDDAADSAVELPPIESAPAPQPQPLDVEPIAAVAPVEALPVDATAIAAAPREPMSEVPSPLPTPDLRRDDSSLSPVTPPHRDIESPSPLPEDDSAATPRLADDSPSASDAAALASQQDLASVGRRPASVEPAAPPAAEPLSPVRPSGQPSTSGAAGNPAAANSTEIGPPLQEVGRSGLPEMVRPVPQWYKNRTSPDRDRIVREQGGGGQTEAAVRAALAWLAANQEPDGRWDSSRHGGGVERTVLGENRGGAGFKADTGVTALAVLAFLGSGHTHLDGPYRQTVARGLEFLLRSQASNGNLYGEATLYAKMYCHAMASLALSEAYALTGDQRLADGVTRAVRFSVSAQHRPTGGWRYQPGDVGDMSQHGWQVLALKSAEQAGVAVPPETWTGAARFVRSVSAGSAGGLASYQPNFGVSRTMTAEALFCRLVLGEADNPRARQEAVQFLLAELPSGNQPNLYYWYYASLALHQLQGDAWRRWNDALAATLVQNQETSGAAAGSWSPETLWGGYGGRVYSTAMGALCLEVYYRYQPLGAGK